MSDLIDRQEAINAFYAATADGDKAEFCVDVIKGLPSVPAAPRWVRCDSGELPEFGKRVLVSTGGWTQILTRMDNERFNGQAYWEDEEGYWELVDSDACWMPLPEPPREGE